MQASNQEPEQEPEQEPNRASNQALSQALSPDAAGSVLLQADGLCFSYPQRALFVDLVIRIPPGVTLVRGGDGRGKTTLMCLLAGALPASSGQLRAGAVGIADEAFKQQVFWADPRSSAFEQMTPGDYFETIRRQHPGFDDAALAILLIGLTLTPHLDKHFYMLSTGSKRKVFLAAALASNATVTLLDAPFAALDRASIDFLTLRLQQASQDPLRAWVLADYDAPSGIALASVIDLGD
jgi:ABC-type multidrug transport system ATPase subunit